MQRILDVSLEGEGPLLKSVLQRPGTCRGGHDFEPGLRAEGSEEINEDVERTSAGE